MRAATYSTLAAFSPNPFMVRQFESLHGPFATKSAKKFAKVVCGHILEEANIHHRRLNAEEKYAVAAILVHRYTRAKPPPYAT